MDSIPSHISHFILILLNRCTSLLVYSYTALKILEFFWIKSLNMSHMHTCVSVGRICRSKLSVQIILRQQTVVLILRQQAVVRILRQQTVVCILRQQTVVCISTVMLNVSAWIRSHFCEFYATLSSSTGFICISFNDAFRNWGYVTSDMYKFENMAAETIFVQRKLLSVVFSWVRKRR